MTNNQDREIKIVDYSNGKSVVERVKGVSHVRSGQEVSEEQIAKWINEGITVIRRKASETRVY